KVGKFSRGMRQRLGLADSLIKEPKVLILDEPTLGLDPMGVKDFTALILQLSREEKLTVLLSSHQLYQVQQICDRVGLFIQGKLAVYGPKQVLTAYLLQHEKRYIQLHIDPSDTERTLLILTRMEAIDTVEQNGDRFQIHTDKSPVQQILKLLV